MFIHCFSPLGRFRKQNWQDLGTRWQVLPASDLQEFWEGGDQEASGSGQHRRWKASLHWKWEASVVPQEVIDKFEGHWVTGRTSHNTDSQWPHTGLGVKRILNLGLAHWPSQTGWKATLWILPQAPTLYASLWWIVMFFYSSHCTLPTPALLHRVDTQLVHTGAGQFMKEGKEPLFFWSSRKKKQKNHSAEWHSLDSSRSRHSMTSQGHFHPLMLRLD